MNDKSSGGGGGTSDGAVEAFIGFVFLVVIIFLLWKFHVFSKIGGFFLKLIKIGCVAGGGFGEFVVLTECLDYRKYITAIISLLISVWAIGIIFWGSGLLVGMIIWAVGELIMYFIATR